MLMAAFLSYAEAQPTTVKTTVETKAVGPVTVTIPASQPATAGQAISPWTLSARGSESDGREYVTIHLSSRIPQDPPKMKVSFIRPQDDMHHVWFSNSDIDRCRMRPDWNSKYFSDLARNVPVYAIFNDSNRNRLTISCDEFYRYVETKLGCREEECRIYGEMSFFTMPEAPISEYEMTLCFDTRDLFWSDAVTEGIGWISESKGIKACNVPDAAFEPLYSSWYQFHQNVFADQIEAECEIAAQLGMKTIIIDDGWQTDDNNKGYAYCGDWQVSKNRFPDMPAHVRKVQDMGIRYLMWYSVPFMGYKSANYERFRGKYLYNIPRLQTSVLDPRFPEVRDYLCDIYVTAMKEWGIDGFKLDFIDKFAIDGTDPAVAEDYAGRDIKSVPEAVDVLMKEVVKRLSAINPDVLIEFRQSYIGPGIRQYGNMMRAGDCPGDLHGNRSRTTNIRLGAGESAVHADMLIWNNVETTESAARPIISTLFTVIQYSVMLREIAPEHREMIRHWLNFSQEHKNALLHGWFRPYHPEALYPVIESGDDKERIIAVYTEGFTAEVADSSLETWIVNSTGAEGLNVTLPAKARKATVFNTLGHKVASVKTVKGIQTLPVPVSGYVHIEF